MLNFYSVKFEKNRYTQGENEDVINKTILKSKNILEIILSLFDYNYQILESSEKENYVIKKSLELSTFLDLNYDNYNYNPKISENLSFLDICDKSNNRYTLDSVLHFDITDITIYKSKLKPITNYKADEIINLAKENNIDILNEKGKKKTKKELYEKLILLG